MRDWSTEPTKKDLMISKIISRAACLAELASNPKSFFNCPDLHGGVPRLLEGRICMTPTRGKKRFVPLGKKDRIVSTLAPAHFTSR
jgi:hypothetical protein